MGTRILLADDHEIMRQGLRSLIEKEADLEVVAEAEDGRTAVTLARKLAPDVVVMDIGMKDLNGIEATRQILAESPRIKIIALSVHRDRRFVEEMLKAGASGYLLKEGAWADLTRAIEVVSSGQVYLSPPIADLVVSNFVRQSPQPDSSPFEVLSPREREVLQLLAEGRSTKEVAAYLHVSVKTVETHRLHIMRKLDMHSMAELTKYAIREGLTPLDH